ncbi:hypothetical protein HDV00_012705 [Rhizophlyctis rosea]|nr:hypothetical protein HDV00_012705 [Rhizophlyctis rosea]
MSPKYIDPVRTGLIGAVIIFPLSIVLINILQRAPSRCYAQVCPEAGNYQTANLVTTYVFYAFLIYMVLLLKVAQKHQWSHTTIRILNRPICTLTTFLVITSVIVHHAFVFGYYWTTVVALKKPAPQTFLDYCSIMFRVAARLLAAQIALQFIPTARDGFLSSYLNIDYDASLQFHRWSGSFIGLWVLLHGGSNIIPNAVKNGSQTWVRGVFGLTTAAPATLPLRYYKYTQLTGFLAGICLLWVGINSIPWIRRKNYAYFRFTHVFALIGVVLGFIHASPVFYMSLPGLLCYILDSFVRRYNRRHAYSITNVTVEKCGYLRVHIKGPRFQYKPAQWVYINVPEVRNLTWHPFTIASSPYTWDESDRPVMVPEVDPPTPSSLKKPHLDNPAPSYAITLQPSAIPTQPISLLIKPSAASTSWTASLLRAWEQRNLNLGNGLRVYIDGPHGTPPKKFFSSDRFICIAGGSGIPGAVGIAKSMLDLNLINDDDELAKKQVRLCWTLRDEESALSSLSLLAELQAHESAPTHLKTHFHSSLPSRLDVRAYLEREVAEWEEAKVVSVSVYCCGPEAFNREVREVAIEVGKTMGVVLRVHVEGYAR